MKSRFSVFIVVLILVGALIIAVDVQQVNASGTIFIRADGSIEPVTANLTSADNVTYSFTDNNDAQIIIERDNIVVDGQGYTLQGTGTTSDPKGISLEGRTNVTVQNTRITNFYSLGIWLHASSGISICGNNITAINDGRGIVLEYSNYNTISGNTFTANGGSIILSSSSNNDVSGNNITHNDSGLLLHRTVNTTISGNTITNNGYGIGLYYCLDTTISGNTITANSNCGLDLSTSNSNNIRGNNVTNNYYGLKLQDARGNTVYHNRFIDNTQQVKVISYSPNDWDDGYPSGGNYWSDYAGVDVKNGSDQNQPGSDGIGDTPHGMDSDNQDRYPLMKPYPWDPHDIGITSLDVSKTVVGQGYALRVNLTMFNYGSNTENFNVTVYVNTSILHTAEGLVLAGKTSTAVTFTWNTAGWTKGNYTLTAVADPVPDETDTIDNAFADDHVFVTIPGDVDGNQEVGIYDLVLIVGGYGKSPWDNRLYANCDIDGNGDVDIFDVVKAAGNYGQSW